MKRWLLLLLLALAALPAHGGSQVILVQNSGWMEPFYRDPASPFKPLLQQLAASVVQPGDAVLLASFSQNLPGAVSPRALLSAKADQSTAARLGQAISKLDVARKPGSQTYADTDLGEALGAALQLKPGLIWLVTNNRNSPNNDQATAARNREFYQLIHAGTAIHTALAWPLAMPVQGQVYRAQGLMLYVFAVGETGAQQLQDLLASGRVQRLLTETPARLKPLDRDTVRLLPRRVDESPGVRFSAAGHSLLADIDPDTAKPEAALTWTLENNIYPYTIRQARVLARSRIGGQEHALTLDDASVRALAPGQARPLRARLTLPVAQLAPAGTLDALAASGSAQVLRGAIELVLDEQQLELSDAFRTRMAQLFPGDPLPEVFTPPHQVKAAHVHLPLEVRAHAGSAALLALAGGLAGLLTLGAAGAHWLLRPRRVRLLVNGEQCLVQLRVGSLQTIFDQHGDPVARLQMRVHGARLLDIREGATVRLA